MDACTWLESRLVSSYSSVGAYVGYEPFTICNVTFFATDARHASMFNFELTATFVDPN